VNEGSSAVTLNAIALGSVIAEALKGSFEGLRDSINAGFAGLGNLIASHFGDDGGEDSGVPLLIRACLRTTLNHLSRTSHPLRNRNRMNLERIAIL